MRLAMRAVQVGHHVVGFDVDVARVKYLASCESYVEDVSSDELLAATRSGRFSPTSEAGDCAGFDVALITVPTPLRDECPDLAQIIAATKTIVPHVRPRSTVVVESTTYPGTVEELVAPILEEGSGLTAGEDFYLGHSPERIDPGNVKWDLPAIPKIVSGVNAASLARITEFYAGLVDQVVPVSSPKVAEFTKLVENTFRHVNIALVNELATLAHGLGIDPWEVVDAAATKPFGFMSFRPGPGVGGHCLPVDPTYLSWRVRSELGVGSRFVELANEVNREMPAYVVRRLMNGLRARGGTLNGARVLLLGLAYKPNTADTRESPSHVVARELVRHGADVHCVDPLVVAEQVDPRLRVTELSSVELAKADAVVLLTDHEVFDYELIYSASRYVLDCRGRVRRGANVERL